MFIFRSGIAVTTAGAIRRTSLPALAVVAPRFSLKPPFGLFGPTEE